jgi:hypothetical protein
VLAPDHRSQSLIAFLEFKSLLLKNPKRCNKSVQPRLLAKDPFLLRLNRTRKTFAQSSYYCITLLQAEHYRLWKVARNRFYGEQESFVTSPSGQVWGAATFVLRNFVLTASICRVS